MIRIIILFVLFIGLAAGIYLVQHPQIFKSRAYQSNASDITNKPNNNPTDGRELGGNKFGMHINAKSPEGTPTNEQFKDLNPGWVRFLYYDGMVVPKFPKNIKSLVIFNGESAPHQPRNDRMPVDLFKEYVDTTYLPKLKQFLSTNPEINALEIWNEQDTCDSVHCPAVYPEAYAYMLKKATALIKSMNPEIKVVIGGLVTGDRGYLEKLSFYQDNIYQDVDGLAVHPYAASSDGWCSCSSIFDKSSEYYCSKNIDPVTGKEKCTGGVLANNDLYGTTSGMWRGPGGIPDEVKIWVTEVGYGTYDREWQAEYLKRTLRDLSSMSDVETIIWYSFSDRIQGADGQSNWGLYDHKDQLTPAGKEFRKFTTSKSD